MNLSGLFYFLTGLILSSTLFLLLSRFSKRKSQITQLARATGRYTRGDLAEKILLEADDEFKVLADAINQMASSLRDKISEAEGERAKVSAILNNMAEGVIACDRAKRILIMNPSAESIFGIRSKSVLGKSLLEATRNPAIDQMIDSAINQKTIITDELELHYPVRRMLRLNAVGISPAEDSHSVVAILVVYDVTEVRKLESMRSDFVANVSHELKTPLTSIKGFIETLSAGAIEDSERAKSFLQMMEEDSERLTRLIGDLLELSKIESKKISLKPETLDLRKEVDQVLVGFKTALEEKQISIENKINSSVSADRDRLKQILINLTENAIKFNKPQGRISFTSTTAGDQVRLEISDTGIGIPKDMIPRVFERFFRIDQARSRDSGGTGLGLAIVKHLVEAHGGQIGCESQPGKGSTFFLTLPSE